jgi:hypothetical protein
MGKGTPNSQSNTPLPKPMGVSSGLSVRRCGLTPDHGTTQGSAIALITKTKVTVLPTSHPRMIKVCRSFSIALSLSWKRTFAGKPGSVVPSVAAVNLNGRD